VDKIEKFLRSLNAKEQEAVLLVMQQLKADPFTVPSVVRLSGMKDWYRVRLGRYRILFTIDPKTREVEIKRIGRRNEKTYKDL
jgi:mRNA interferase RelE/StbE